MESIEKKKILIAGGSGFIGKSLSHYLIQQGYSVSILSRSLKTLPDIQSYYWNPVSGKIDVDALIGKEVIMNLAGAGLADKFWTKKRKQEIIDSRIMSTDLLVKTIQQLDKKPSKFISASAIGFYGDRPGEILSENSNNGDGFLAGLCKSWEDAAFKINFPEVQTTTVRIGVVVAENKGFAAQITKMAKAHINFIPGTGSQMVSWIYIDDLCRIFEFLIEKSHSERIVNAVSPEPCSLGELQKIIITKNRLKAFHISIPKFLMKFFLGSFSELFLNDEAVLPEKLLRMNFEYQNPEPESIPII